ncbi:MAG: cytidine deaminase [Muribaculaceae bacterium]
MKNFTISIPVEVFSYSELSPQHAQPVDLARRYTDNAYSPYSKFRVGAAILLDNGQIVCGANQENVAYPSGTCAERSACFAAGAQFPGVAFRAIAIASVGTDGLVPQDPTAPCGACRQALLEYETLAARDVQVILAGRDKVYVLPSVKSLLPLAFSEF